MADNQNKKFTDFVYTSSDFFGDTSGLGAFTPVVAGVHTYRTPLGYIPTCTEIPTDTPNSLTGFAPLRLDVANDVLYAYYGGSWVAVGSAGSLTFTDPAYPTRTFTMKFYIRNEGTSEEYYEFLADEIL